MGAHICCIVEEQEQLRIAMLDISNGARCKKAIPQEANSPLDLAFLLWFANPAESGCDTELPCQCEQIWMVPHRIAVALEDNDLWIVEQPLPRHPTEVATSSNERTSE